MHVKSTRSDRNPWANSKSHIIRTSSNGNSRPNSKRIQRLKSQSAASVGMSSCYSRQEDLRQDIDCLQVFCQFVINNHESFLMKILAPIDDWNNIDLAFR